MDYLITRDDGSQTIAHFGIKGQKHGIRRFQNEDGSLTAEGRQHYGVGEGGPGMSSGSQNNGGSKSQSFVQRHKKGLAIAGGVLAAGLAAVAISQVVKSNNAKKGADSVNKILGGDGYNKKGTVFTIQGKKGTVSGYYSPEMAAFMRKTGQMPGQHAKNAAFYTKAIADGMNRMRR